MFNKVYYKYDNILNTLTIHPTLNDTFESTDVTVSDSTIFNMTYNHLYPTVTDSTCYQPSNIVSYTNRLEFLPDTTTVLDFVLFDDYMKLCCEELCSSDNVFKLNTFELTFSGVVNGVFNSKAIFLYEQKNPLTNNIVYDYILSNTGTNYYNNQRQELIPKRELVGYVDTEYLPEYLIKCIDQTGGIVYKNIFLNDLEYSSAEGILTSTFYDVTTVESTTDDIQKSCKTISILFTSQKFKLYFQTLRETYKEVRFLLKVKNQSSSSNMVIYKSSCFFNWYRGSQFYWIASLNNINNLVDYSSQFLNRGTYLKYNSSDIESMITENGNVSFSLNNLSFEPDNFEVNKTLFTSDNYIIENESKTYMPFELFKTNNVFTITFKDQINPFLIKLTNDVVFTLMRQLTSSSSSTAQYNPENTIYNIENFQYMVGSYRTDFTNTIINDELLITSQFNSEKTNMYSLSKSDITNVFNVIDQDLSVNVFQRKISKRQTYVYIQFKKDHDVNYLKKYIAADIIDLVLQNIIISVTQMELSTNSLSVTLQTPPNEHINKYSDDTGTVTYMYLMKDMEILSINGIYNRQVIESNYDEEHVQTQIYYMPSDVIIISDNKT